ncbi:putative lipid II flippase FtsW [Propionibacteriaceae bacterium G1746]|uniref:putative lipid II flippase FtsW n=1 Tax=Aestuariimicrobium sp. G57 TaxID=3418485 RepID=UPI003C23CD47
MLHHPNSDLWMVVTSVAILVGIGLLMSLSSSSVYAQANGDGAYYYAIRQLIFLALGVPAAIVLARLNERVLKPLSWAGMMLAVVLLVLVFTPLGLDIKGNRAWLELGPISLQPSEFAKVAVILWVASVFSMKQKVLDQPKHLLVPMLPGAGLVTLLVLLQGDLGTGMIMVAIVFLLLWVVGTPWVVLGGLVTAAIAVVGLLVVSSENRMHRIMLFLNPPPADDLSVSQQPLSAIYALASGGWFGQGLGASKQKWGGLYDGAQNDFVFAVIGEEMGLLGTLLVIALFTLLGFAGFRIALRSSSLFYRVLAGGVTSWLLFQAIVNISVAMKLLPVVGVPLPFISVGGSALLANLLAAGLLMCCARHEPGAVRARSKDQAPGPKVTTVVQRGRASSRN